MTVEVTNSANNELLVAFPDGSTDTYTIEIHNDY